MKYPAGVKVVPTVHKKEDIQYGNRGMSLEHDLNITNDYYRESDRALIYKKPTPIKVTKVDYQKSSVVIKGSLNILLQRTTTVSIMDYISILKQRKL